LDPIVACFWLGVRRKDHPLFACVWALRRSQPCVLYVQKMMTSLPGCLLCSFFSYRRQWQAKRLIVVLWFFFWVAENDDKPFSSSSSYGFFLGLKKMTTSLPTHRHLVVFSLGYRRWQQIAKLIIDLFFFKLQKTIMNWEFIVILWFFFLNCRKQQWAFWLIIILWFFFLDCKKKKHNKPRSSSSSYGYFFELHKRTTNLWTHHHLVLVFLGL